jgi:hypothetical protein
LILTGLTYGSEAPSGSPSVSPKARLTIATSQDLMLLQPLDSPFYLKLRCQLELTYIFLFTCGCLAGGLDKCPTFLSQFLAQLVAQFLAQFLLNSWPISTYPSRYNQPNTMDIGLPASSPSRVNLCRRRRCQHVVVWIPGPIPTTSTSNSLIWPLKTKGIAYLHYLSALIIGITLIIKQP